MNNDDYVIDYGALTKGTHMQTEGTKITQEPELYLAADVEQMSKGGWKRTVKVSVRVFDGNEAEANKYLERLLENGLGIANDAVNDFDKHQEATNGPE